MSDDRNFDSDDDHRGYPSRGYGRRDGREDGDGRDSEIISLQDKHKFHDAFQREGNQTLSDDNLGKTEKVFGLFELDAGLAKWVMSLYNLGSDAVAAKARSQTFRLTEAIGRRAGYTNESHLKTAAAAATIVSTVAVKGGAYIGGIVDEHSKQRKERKDLARRIAPVLDDIKGSHSVGALFGVTPRDNEVIYAHRKRLSTIASANNMNGLIDLGVNAGPNILLDGEHMKVIWDQRRDVTHHEFQLVKRQQDPYFQNNQNQPGHHQNPHGYGQPYPGSAGNMGNGNVVRMFLNTSVGQLSGYLKKSTKHKLSTSLQPYSALEMILELEDQVSSGPESRSFQVPRSFRAPNSHPEQFPLEEYVMRIFIQHQKEMADLSPDHTEIREALREDLAAVAKPIAKAIRDGDMSVMSLVRLAGEGKIVKKRGRAIASVEEVKALIKREEPKQASYAQIAPDEYYKDAPFTRAQFKQALSTLDGEEKLVFASMFSDAMLAEGGMSKKEIRKVREAVTADVYDKMLGEAIVGANGQTDDKLKADGLAENEVKTMREDFKKIEHSGAKAVHELKTSAVNENGVERLLANMVVHQPKYLGKLLKDGREQFGELAANDGAHGRAANDDSYDGERDSRGHHSARETLRRANGAELEAGHDY